MVVILNGNGGVCADTAMGRVGDVASVSVDGAVFRQQVTRG